MRKKRNEKKNRKLTCQMQMHFCNPIIRKRKNKKHGSLVEKNRRFEGLDTI
jgi:hypothetical protein